MRSQTVHGQVSPRLRYSIPPSLLLLVVVALVSSEAVAQPFSEQAQLVASDAFAGDNFGSGVAISGDTAIVGANLDDDHGDGSGSAYVFERDQAGNWALVKKLTASDAAGGDNFGASVAIHGDTAIVGAYGNNELHGSAYIFERDAGGPNQWGQVKRFGVPFFAYFGFDVAIHDDTVIVGAPGETSSDLNNDGTAYIFRRDQGGANNWGQVKKLTSAGAAVGGGFGVTVSMSGDTALVGAWLEDPGAVNDAGAAYLFRRNQDGSNNWGQQSKLTASDGAESDRFGRAVWIRGDRAIVGAPDDDFAVNFEDSGSAYVFVRNQAGNWIEARKLIAGDPEQTDQFGSSVSIEGDTALVGSPGDDVDTNFNEEGSAYLFRRNRGGPDNWGQLQKLAVSPPPANEVSFGTDTSLDGDTAVIGAPRFDHDDLLNPGAAFVFVAPPVVPSLSPAAAVVAACLVLLASAFARPTRSRP